MQNRLGQRTLNFGRMALYTWFSLISVCTLANTELTWQELNKQVIDEHIMPGYKNMYEASVMYRSYVEGLCIDNGPTELEVVRAAFKQLTQLWQNTQHLRLGPIEEDKRFYQIQFFPDKRGSVGKQVNKMLQGQDIGLLIPENFAKQSVAVQGLPMMERLLFTDEKIDDYRCGLLLVASLNLQKQLGHIQTAWLGDEATPGYRTTLLETELEVEDAEFGKHSDVASKLLKVLVTAMQGVKENKLERAMTADINKAKPSRLEFWQSGQSLDSIISNLVALEKMYQLGFASFVKAFHSEVHVKLTEQFKSTLYLAKSMESSLYEQLQSADKSKVLALHDSVSALYALMLSELPKSVGLTLGFNSLDGD